MEIRDDRSDVRRGVPWRRAETGVDGRVRAGSPPYRRAQRWQWVAGHHAGPGHRDPRPGASRSRRSGDRWRAGVRSAAPVAPRGKLVAASW